MSVVAAPVCVPTHSARHLHVLHTLASPCHLFPTAAPEGHCAECDKSGTEGQTLHDPTDTGELKPPNAQKRGTEWWREWGTGRRSLGTELPSRRGGAFQIPAYYTASIVSEAVPCG